MSASRSKPRANTAFARLKEQLSAVDLLFEVRDARIPKASQHPKAEEIFGTRPRIIVLAKQDLADPDLLKGWLDFLARGDNRDSIALSFKHQKGQDKLISKSLLLTQPRRDALARKGLLPRPMRVCVVGMPNTGKSTLINWLIGKNKARTGDKPGITRGTQWVRVHPQLELLDTPGILPSVAFNDEVKMRLALCNIIPEDHYDFVEAAEFGLSFIQDCNRRDALSIYGDRFASSASLTLEGLALARSCLKAGGTPDVRRAAALFLSDFKNGRLGKFVLEKPV